MNMNPYQCSNCGGEMGHESDCPWRPAALAAQAAQEQANEEKPMSHDSAEQGIRTTGGPYVPDDDDETLDAHEEPVYHQEKCYYAGQTFEATLGRPHRCTCPDPASDD